MGKPSIAGASIRELESLAAILEEVSMKQGSLPRIDVTYEDLAEQTKLTWEAIERANRTPFLFRRGPIVRIERTETDSLIVREVTPDRMRHAIATIAVWFKPQ